MLFSACSLVASVVPVAAGMADTTTNGGSQVNLGVQLAQAGVTSTPEPNSTIEPQSGTNGKAIPPNVSRGASESIIVKAQRRLVKEKNSPSAVTELGAQQIAATGVAGNVGTLLRQAPSVYVYSQGLGDNAPELTVRGLRGLEIATTLDGIPTQDLEAPGASSIANNIGGPFTLTQISGVSIYPGVAYPDKSTFGTIGGTIAYATKRPTNDFYVDVTGTVGSFGTYREGFEVNSGKLDGLLGSGDNAPSLLLNYNNLQTQGFIDGTPNRENEMEFAFDKPYNDGLSAFQATVIYNTANGLVENEPVPTPYLNKNGAFSNYPTDLVFGQEKNDYLTIILKNDTYVNDYLNVGLTAFYLNNNNQTETYGSILNDQPGGVAGPLTVGNSSPFINNPGGFGEGGLYGPAGGGDPFGIYGSGYGGYFYGSGNRYNPAKYYNNPKACPPSIIATYGGAGFSPCGLNDQITAQHNDTYGIQPRVTILVPEYFGIANTIKIGGLFAKETTPISQSYLGAFPQTPMTEDNASNVPTGGTQRTIYQGYIQDKIDLLDNTLHLTPGGTLEGTFSSFKGSNVFGSTAAPIYGANGLNNGGTDLDQYGPFKQTKWDREALPFFNVSYDFDKVLPAAKGLSAYGSIGNSALFAPVGDFGPDTAGPPPFASIVHFYEGGVKYNIANLALSTDYFYQKVDRDFGYFSFQSGPQNGLSVYSGFGQREFKGVEGSAIWQVTPAIQLFGNFSHTLSKYLTSGSALDTVAEDQYGTVFKGDPQTGTPDWLSTFGVDYNRKSLFRDNDAINVRLTGQYTGKQPTSYDLGADAYLNVPNYPGLAPLDFTPGSCPAGSKIPVENSCAYTRYNQVTGATTYDPHGGISPFAIFNLDVNYELPTPWLPVLKKVTFDANIQNLFDARYFQYYYKQISPASCGTIASGPLKGAAANNYSCGGQFADAIPGQPFSIFFSVTARF